MDNYISISDARANLPTLIDRISKNLDRFLITVRGEPKAAVLSFEELESLEETAEVLAIPKARESIRRGLKQAKKRQGILLEKMIK